MKTTTAQNITADQCFRLAEKAAVAGDLHMQRIALVAAHLLDREHREGGVRDQSCVRACVAAICDAEGQVRS